MDGGPFTIGECQSARVVVIRAIKRSRVGEAFWISADRGMAASDEAVIGCEEGDKAVWLPTLFLRWSSGWLAGCVGESTRCAGLAGRQGREKRSERRRRTESEAARSGEPCTSEAR